MFCLAKVMTKTRFWPGFGVFDLFWGPAGCEHVVTLKAPQNPQNLKMSKKFVTRVLTQIFFRLLKDPKRLGLGQKVPGKHPLGSNRSRFMGPKTQVPISTKMGQKWHFWEKLFWRFGHKTGKTGRFLYCRVYLESRNHNKDTGKG